MKRWLDLSNRIDGLNRWIGQLVGWLTLAMVLVGAFNALARYTGKFTEMQLASNAYIELQWYLFSLLFLLGAAHTLERDQHVRVDVFYGRLTERGKAWIDVIGGFVFLLPFCAFGLWMSYPTVRNSWAVREVSPDPGGLVRYPIKAMILVCFALLAIQGVSEIIKRIAVLRGHRLGTEPGGDP
jgi:TRAP-type mannitol/chloroaromatic compound transport system permease small subunit